VQAEHEKWRNSSSEKTKKTMEEKPKHPTSAKILSNVPRRDTYGQTKAAAIRTCSRANCKESGIPLRSRRNKNTYGED